MARLSRGNRSKSSKERTSRRSGGWGRRKKVDKHQENEDDKEWEKITLLRQQRYEQSVKQQASTSVESVTENNISVSKNENNDIPAKVKTEIAPTESIIPEKKAPIIRPITESTDEYKSTRAKRSRFSNERTSKRTCRGGRGRKKGNKSQDTKGDEEWEKITLIRQQHYENILKQQSSKIEPISDNNISVSSNDAPINISTKIVPDSVVPQKKDSKIKPTEMTENKITTPSESDEMKPIQKTRNMKRFRKRQSKKNSKVDFVKDRVKRI